MPAYTTLPTGWQTELGKKVGANPYLELIYDPDGENISLTGKYSVSDVGTIKNVRDIDPVWGTRPTISEIQIFCHDPDGYLNPESSASPFHNAMGILYAEAASGQADIQIDADNISFAVGEVLTINDGTNSESVTVAAFVTGGRFHTITADGNLSNTYAVDTAIYTIGAEYKDMMLRMRFSGLTNWVTLYWGKLLRINYSTGQAIFVVTDRRKLKLDQTLIKADSSAAQKLMWINTSGNLTNSVTWNTDSAGGLDRTLLTIKDACRLGNWTLDFDSSTTYSISGPGAENESGDLAVDTVTALSLESATTGLNGASDVFVTNNYAYIVSRLDNSFRIYDITDPAAPSLLSTTTSATYLSGASGIIVIGSYAYICNYTGRGITIYNISTPASPVRCGYVTGQSDLNGAEDIDVLGNYAYVVSSVADSLSVYDISNPNTVVLRSTVTGVGSPNYLNGACSIKVVSNYAYIASRDDHAITIFNVSDASNPVHTGEVHGYGVPNVLGQAQGIDVDGDFAYICGKANDVLVVIDVSDPSNPFRRGQVIDATNLNGPRSVKVMGNYAYLTCEDGDAVSVVNISVKAAPVFVYRLSGAGSPNYLNEARGIYARGSYIYVTSYTDDAFVIVDITASITQDFENDQIIIPANAWSGVINSGDSVTFCTGINYENMNPVQALYNFLTTHVTVENKFIDCSSYFGNKTIGTLYASADAGETAIQVSLLVPTLIKTGETLVITEGATTEEVTVATGVTANTCYPPYISLTVSVLANSYTTAATVVWKERVALDTTFSFDNEYNYCDLHSINISITYERDMSKQQALESIASHLDGFTYQDNWGVEKVHSYRKRSTTRGTIQYNTNLKLPNPELEVREIINKFRFQYGYDYVNDSYLYEMVYPSDDSTNWANLRYGFIREEIIKLPGTFSSSVINLFKVNKLKMWDSGINIIRFSTTLQGLVAMIADHFNFVSLYPALSTEIEVMGIESMSVTGKIDIQLIAWDYGKIFG